MTGPVKSLKIAFLAPHLRVAGGTRIFLTYAHLLQKRGHQVTVYVRSSNRFRRWVANTLQIGKPYWVKGFLPRIMRVPQFSDKYIKGQDVVVPTNAVTAMAADKFALPDDKKYFFAMHDEALYHAEPALAEKAYRLPMKKIVISTWLKEILREKYGTESELLVQPVDTEFFHPTERVKSDGTIRILLLQHPYEWKGTAEGVRIVTNIKKRHSNVRLIMYGAKKKDDAYPTDEYYFDIAQEKLSSLYSNCDIYLCPSWDEGFGMPPQEAMACGVAVATYDNGGSRDFAFHERTALVAPRKDEAALEAQVERLVVDPALRKRLAAAGLDFVRRMPTWEEQADKLERLILGGT